MNKELQERIITFVKGLQHYDFEGVNNIHDVKRLCMVIASYHKQEEVLSIGDYIKLIDENIGFSITDDEKNVLAKTIYEKVIFGEQVLQFAK